MPPVIEVYMHKPFSQMVEIIIHCLPGIRHLVHIHHSNDAGRADFIQHPGYVFACNQDIGGGDLQLLQEKPDLFPLTVHGQLCQRLPAVFPRLFPGLVKITEACTDLDVRASQELRRVNGSLIIADAGLPCHRILGTEIYRINTIFRRYSHYLQVSLPDIPVQLNQPAQGIIKNVKLGRRAVKVDTVKGRALHFVQEFFYGIT